MGDIITASGTKIYIGPVAVPEQTDDLAEFEAISGWIEIGLVETLGEFGDEFSSVSFNVMGQERTRKKKSTRNPGSLIVTCGHDPQDSGQEALGLAQRSTDNYAFKIVIPDAATSTYTDTIVYFCALVMSKRKNVGANDNVVRTSYGLEINSEIVVYPSQAVSADGSHPTYFILGF